MTSESAVRPKTITTSLYLTNNVTILLYVDDLRIFFNSRENVGEIKEKLKEKYRTIDLGPARRFLGMNIDTTELGFSLNQTSYIERLLRRFKMTDAYSSTEPSSWPKWTTSCTQPWEHGPTSATPWACLAATMSTHLPEISLRRRES